MFVAGGLAWVNLREHQTREIRNGDPPNSTPNLFPSSAVFYTQIVEVSNYGFPITAKSVTSTGEVSWIWDGLLTDIFFAIVVFGLSAIGIELFQKDTS